jgi:hypothetical protein
MSREAKRPPTEQQDQQPEDSTQRSNPHTPEHENTSSNQTMTFQPTRQRQDQTLGAHLGITIRWGVRAGARRRTHTTTVDLVRGW